MKFNSAQQQRYHRHFLLSEVGLEGQTKLAQAKILVIGAGGLGSPVLLYLAAAGVGTIGIVDGDVVELSNLQRQIVHFSEDIGCPKIKSAQAKIERLNPDVRVITYPKMADARNILSIIDDFDFIMECTDNFTAKFLINDACVLSGKPFSHGGIMQFVGQTMTVIPGESACYRCVFNQPPPKGAIPEADNLGVLGAIPGVLGTLQAVEALKFIINKGDLLLNRLLIFDGLNMDCRTVMVKRRMDCPVCGDSPTIKDLNAEKVI